MKWNLRFAIAIITIQLVITEIFFIGYMVKLNKAILFIGYILITIMFFPRYIAIRKNRIKNVPIKNPVLEGEQLLYVKFYLNKIKNTFSCSKKQRNRIINYKNYLHKIENSIPLTESEIHELNKIL